LRIGTIAIPKCGNSAIGRNTVSLPGSFAARGLSRVQAAEYLGVAVTKFDEMVTDGLMPVGGGFTRYDLELLEKMRATPFPKTAGLSSNSFGQRRAELRSSND
jgi:hypothetical protein